MSRNQGSLLLEALLAFGLLALALSLAHPRSSPPRKAPASDFPQSIEAALGWVSEFRIGGTLVHPDLKAKRQATQVRSGFQIHLPSRSLECWSQPQGLECLERTPNAPPRTQLFRRVGIRTQARRLLQGSKHLRLLLYDFEGRALFTSLYLGEPESQSTERDPDPGQVLP